MLPTLSRLRLSNLPPYCALFYFVCVSAHAHVHAFHQHRFLQIQANMTEQQYYIFPSFNVLYKLCRSAPVSFSLHNVSRRSFQINKQSFLLFCPGLNESRTLKDLLLVFTVPQTRCEGYFGQGYTQQEFCTLVLLCFVFCLSFYTTEVFKNFFLLCFLIWLVGLVGV